MSDIETGMSESPESSASSEPASQAPAQPAAPQQEAAANQVKETPFHEHPRFKELIEQRNQEREERSRLSQAYQQLQSQIQELTKQQNARANPQESYDDLFKELEQVNPKFAKLIQGLQSQVAESQTYKQQIETQGRTLEDFQQQRNAEYARSQFDNLCKQHKVDDGDKELYEMAVANIANTKNARVQDLPQIFQEAHDRVSKYLEGRDRKVTKSYVTNKKADAAPTSQTGGTPTGIKGPGINSLDDVKAALAAKLRGSKNITF